MPPRYWLQRLWLLYHAGKGNFPLRMGLSLHDWQALQQQLGDAETALDGETLSRRRLMAELNATREDECQQLKAWLASWMQPECGPMAQIIAAVSLAFNHLWQDLGLESRAELRQLMSDCFPQLVVMNQQNMRWKKFFYRQRCLLQLGEVVCRSPSCDECWERSRCFEELM